MRSCGEQQTSNQRPHRSVKENGVGAGHTLRKPVSNIARQVLTWNPQGKRKRGRPWNTWRRGTGTKMLRSRHSWKDRLVGQVVRRPPRERKILGLDFFGVESYQ